ncbi:MAG: hypothetical protein ABI548_04290 [Polyangiaceae bacterium]
MNALSFEGVSHAELVSVSTAFTPGTHVVLGSERDGTHTLVQLAAGVAPPSAGHVQLNGVAPFTSAATRRAVGSLCANEALPHARTVSAALALALRARADARSVTSVLGAAGLTRLAARRTSELTARETRAIALALALSHPKPHLLALHEPLSLVDLVREEFILEALSAAADSGVIVLASASGLEDASRLGGEAHALDRGIWLDSAHARLPALRATLRVQTPDPRRLAARLSEVPDIQGVSWAGASELLVHGSNLERLAHSVVSNARAEAIQISALRQELPALDALSAARASMARPTAPTRPE